MAQVTPWHTARETRRQVKSVHSSLVCNSAKVETAPHPSAVEWTLECSSCQESGVPGKAATHKNEPHYRNPHRKESVVSDSIFVALQDPRIAPSHPHPKSKSMPAEAREPEGESPVCSAVCGGVTRLSAGRSWESVCPTSGLPCLSALHAPFSELSWKPGAPSLWLDSTLLPQGRSKVEGVGKKWMGVEDTTVSVCVVHFLSCPERPLQEYLSFGLGTPGMRCLCLWSCSQEHCLTTWVCELPRAW